MLTNMYNDIEIWGLRSKVKENLLKIKGEWQCCQVSNTTGDLFYQLEDGILTRFNPVTKKEVYKFKKVHSKTIAHSCLTSDDSILVAFGWDGLVVFWKVDT